jgi:parallel beta-helix repeat protein
MNHRWAAVFAHACVLLWPVLGPRAAESPETGPIVVRGNIRLQADVRVPPGGVGLQIAVPDARIDLNGHQILGEGSGVGIQIEHQTGSLVSGGTVRGCERGVVISGGEGHRLLGLTVVEQAGDGVQIVDSSHNEVTACTLSRNGQYGLSVRGGDRNRIAANRIDENRGSSDSGGITLQHTRENLLRDNRLRSNGTWGIRLREGSERNQVLRTEISGSGLLLPDGLWSPHPGVVLDDGATENELRENVATGNSYGLFFWAGAARNRIERNVGTGNISFDLVDLNPECGSNVWIDNRFERAHYACN